MKNIVYSLIIIGLTFASCKRDDESKDIKLRDRQEVYDENIIEIENYLKNNYMTVNGDNVGVWTIPEGGSQVSIFDQTNYPLQFITVKNDTRNSILTDGRVSDNVEYKLYYVVINEGGGSSPKSVDSTFVSYKGWDLKNEVFDQNNTGAWFSFPEANLSTISGFRQVLSKIKTAESATLNNPDNGIVNYNNPGRVIVFIPSGLAYFGSYAGGTAIAPYSSIVFDIRLLARKERDHDGDRVLSVYEDLNDDNDFFNDDTDGDKLPDFLDIDDDNDYMNTIFEVRNPTGGYFDFNDIPTCTGGTLKRHLDPNCKYE